MFIETHIIQNFAPSCLNRDDTNTPKDCVFGGHRRARISSQCLKRAIRTHVQAHDVLPLDFLAVRTKRLLDQATSALMEKGHAEEEAAKVAKVGVEALGLAFAEGDKTQYLLYVSRDGINAFVDACHDHWDALMVIAEAEEKGSKKGKKDKKAAGFSKDVKAELGRLFDGGRAIDLALFGRMLADLPGKNIDAAAQVAHAISTNRVAMEMDFYTAVDDLKPGDSSGADMMGIVEFNSSCFYRYSVLHVPQLLKNLGDDQELVDRAVEAYLLGAIHAVPTGKQNSMAAHNPPSYVRVMLRKKGEPWNLANSFLEPVFTGRQKDLARESIAKLEDHLVAMRRMYGDLTAGELDIESSLYNAESATIDDLVTKVVEGIR